MYYIDLITVTFSYQTIQRMSEFPPVAAKLQVDVVIKYRKELRYITIFQSRCCSRCAEKSPSTCTWAQGDPEYSSKGLAPHFSSAYTMNYSAPILTLKKDNLRHLSVFDVAADAHMLSQMVELGFERELAEQALIQTKNTNIQNAMDW